MDVYGIRKDLIAEYSSYVRSVINIRDPGGPVLILDTFPIVRRKDESRWGECRARRVILEIYDAMAEAQQILQPYTTRLDPRPASPPMAHPSRTPNTVQGDIP